MDAKVRKMKRFPIYRRDEGWSCNEAFYDPYEDFALFLEEARKHESKTQFQASPTEINGVETRKKKKSWKRSLSFLCWKSDKKSTAQKEEHKMMKSSHSGQLFGGRGGDSTLLRRSIRQPVSGPLAAWFSQTKEEETESPYIYLGTRNYSSCSHAFGPIYLVT